MRAPTSALILAAATALLAGCASVNASTPVATSASPSQATTVGTEPAPSAAAPQMLTARAVMAKLTAAIPQAQQTAVYTEASDPNHLLGRPNQYTSKVEFKDTRIPAGQVTDVPAGSIQYGGSVEVFATSADAATRAAQIQENVNGQPATMEYDYVHGDVLLRLSHYVTPTQAKAYEAFANTLP